MRAPSRIATDRPAGIPSPRDEQALAAIAESGAAVGPSVLVGFLRGCSADPDMPMTVPAPLSRRGVAPRPHLRMRAARSWRNAQAAVPAGHVTPVPPTPQ
jgi:hypothetical protein